MRTLRKIKIISHMVIDVLLPLLTVADQIKLALCSVHILQKCPVSKLYFRRLPRGSVDRVRKMILRASNGTVPSSVTHLLLTNIFGTVKFCDTLNLVHLRMEGCGYNTVLPCGLKSFIGINIRGKLALSESLTHLELQGAENVQIFDLARHPNLTVLRLDVMQTPRVALPPNLIELNALDCYPNALDCFPETLEKLDLYNTCLSSLSDLPASLRKLALASFEGACYSQVAKCSALTEIVIYDDSPSAAMCYSLQFISECIPQVTDLTLTSRSIMTIEALNKLKFENLQRLKMNIDDRNEAENLNLRHLLKLRDLEIQCSSSRVHCIVELPTFLSRLTLKRRYSCHLSQFRITLPVLLQILCVQPLERYAFSILIHREHLGRLKIVDEDGQRVSEDQIAAICSEFTIL